MDNAKNSIETGFIFNKLSKAYKATVTCDTFGDPLKDTAGPSQHIVMKLMKISILTFIPIFFGFLVIPF
ncbi:MAG: sodium/proton-translocating pyrophosphatase [Promethearchaeota archaeon]